MDINKQGKLTLKTDIEFSRQECSFDAKSSPRNNSVLNTKKMMNHEDDNEMA